jgi:hypothetical protein
MKNHPHLGKIDMTHIPLDTLRQFFPKEYQKIKIYKSYAIIRNPFARFKSSVTQHLAMYGSAPLQRIIEKELKKTVNSIIDYLSTVDQSSSMLPSEYIHFQRQIDYIYEEDKRLIDNIYLIENIDQLLVSLENLIGCSLRAVNEDKSFLESRPTVAYRNEFIRILHRATWPFTNKIFSIYLHPKTKKKIKSYIYTPNPSQHRNIFNSNYLKDFITYYYRDDIYLLNQLSSKNCMHSN